MGFNTAMVVLNDHLHEIEKSQDFGQRVATAIRYAGRGDRLYSSGFSVLPTQHADTMQICAIGGNTIRRLGFGSWSADNERLLRDLARDLGYRLVKLPGRPSSPTDSEN